MQPRCAASGSPWHERAPVATRAPWAHARRIGLPSLWELHLGRAPRPRPCRPLDRRGHEMEAHCADHRRSCWGLAPHSDELASGTGRQRDCRPAVARSGHGQPVGTRRGPASSASPAPQFNLHFLGAGVGTCVGQLFGSLCGVFEGAAQQDFNVDDRDRLRPTEVSAVGFVCGAQVWDLEDVPCFRRRPPKH